MRRTALAVLLCVVLPSDIARAASFTQVAAPDGAIGWSAASVASDGVGSEGVGSLDLFPNAWERSDDGEVTDLRHVYEAGKRYRLFEQVGFVWTQSLDRVSLGVWNARGIASDGSTAVGVGVPPSSSGYAISPDGSTVVGYAATASGTIEVMRWTAAAGIVALGASPGGTADRATIGDGTATTRDVPLSAWTAMIPEPAAGSLVALGLAGLAARRRSA